MGMEVAGSDLPKVNGEVKPKVHDQEVGEAITFGSHGVDEEEAKGEKDSVSNANISKDNAADAWADVQHHYFWFVKQRPLEDPNLKVKMDKTEKDIQKYQQEINRIFEEINAKTPLIKELQAEKKALYDDMSQYQAFIDEKREEMKPLQNALGTLRGGGGGGVKGSGICSSEEELNQLIRSIEYQIQHESMSLKEEKKLLKEIKELEATRPKVIANSAERAKLQESMGKKEDILDQVKLLGTDVDGVRKQKAAVIEKKERLKPQLSVLRAQRDALYEDVKILKTKRDAALETMKKLREQRDKGNAYFYNVYRPLITKAKEIAVKKDVKALDELSSIEVENFMSQWNSSKTFRDDYEKRILKSLDFRQMSRDGRIRNFDEKPLVTESPRPELDAVSKSTSKQQKEVAENISKVENLPVEKAQKETKKGKKELKSASERAAEEEDVFVVEKPKKDVQKDNEMDAAKLRELKKEEEKEKNRQALERKKKIQEKAAAKAAARAQKEAEKKQKEREKKLRKKESSSSQPIEEEPAEKSECDEAEKPDIVEEAIETPVPSKVKVQQNSLRHRKPIKTRGAPPKALLKKKKSDKYLLWGSAAAAAVGVLLLVVLVYKYYL